MKKTFLIGWMAILGMGLRADPIVVADFEGPDYGAWQVTGTAFGHGPAQGTLPGQMHVDGFKGAGLVNSYVGGDDAVGTLTSPPFKIERRFLNFLIGGGGWEGRTCMNLLVAGKIVCTATGPNTKLGGSETLEPASWDVSAWLGQEAQLVIIDQAKGGWGHILIDQVELDDKPAASLAPLVTLQKELEVQQTHLLIPIANEVRGKNAQLLSLKQDGNLLQTLQVTLPLPNQPYWWAAYPLGAFDVSGKKLQIALADGAKVTALLQDAFAQIHLGAEREALRTDDYTQPYRNQLHASSRHGWNNDPNGMVYAQGKYHLYYQYNPVGIFWGNMHWGHLESKDLVHWEEQPIALFQKTVRDMAYSGGGFVDEAGTAGLGKGLQCATFTSTGRGECVVYSLDQGRTFKELPENPVVKHQGRDPRVFWYEPKQQWVMAVYAEDAWDGSRLTPTPQTKAEQRHIAFYASKDLHHWEWTGAFTDADRGAVYECPEIFPLTVVGRPEQQRWILLAASNRYFIGQFDGQTFQRESGPWGTRHGAFYAAQTFSQAPNGRRVEIGWLQTASYEKIFPTQCSNQGFTLAHELTLHETSQGLRLFYNPVKEFVKLREKILVQAENVDGQTAERLLQACQGQLCEVEVTLSQSAPVKLALNGIDASFVGQRAQIFADRTVNEVYADEGASYEIYKRPAQDFNRTLTRWELPPGVKVTSLKAYRLRSIWEP